MNNLSKTRIKVLEKLIFNGYDTDKKVIDLKIEDLISNNNFSRSDLEIIVRIKNALINKELFSFISGSDKEVK